MYQTCPKSKAARNYSFYFFIYFYIRSSLVIYITLKHYYENSWFIYIYIYIYIKEMTKFSL